MSQGGAGPLFAGLDAGTQGLKAVLVDAERAEVVARASVPYGLIAGLEPGAVEQHPDTWIDAVREAFAAFARDGADLARVAGVGVSGQQHGFVALDRDGTVLRPAKLWCDTSTAAEARELSERFGRAVPTGFTASKILRMKRREPHLFARLATVLLPHDHVNFRLTGVRAMEAGDASGTGVFDPVARAFVETELRAIDAKLPSCMPPLVAPGEPVGTLSAEGAALTGLRAGIPVAAGGGDNMMAAIGGGATRPGVAVLSLGTSGTVFAYAARAVVDPDGMIAPFCDSTGGWLPLLCVMNATNVTEEVRLATGWTLERLTAAAREIPPGCRGARFLPYVQGERVPDLPHATGALLGIRPGSLAPGALFRAALEGVALNLGCGVERLRRLGVAVDAVQAAGGGAKNDLWLEILANVFDAPIVRLAEPEAAALGAAIQACWTVRRMRGENVSCDAVARPFVRLDATPFEPERETAALYRDLRASFEADVARLWERGQPARMDGGIQTSR